MRKRNSVKQIVEFLNLTVCATEGQIQRMVFGYDRSSTYDSNKKYADMLRRGLDKGLYRRFAMDVPGMGSKVFYYTGDMMEMVKLQLSRDFELKLFVLNQEKESQI